MRRGIVGYVVQGGSNNTFIQYCTFAMFYKEVLSLNWNCEWNGCGYLLSLNLPRLL